MEKLSRYFFLALYGSSSIVLLLILGTIPTNGIAVTGAGKLPCSHVIHIEAPMETDWPCIITKVLVEAEKRHIKSVSFPALGTGEFVCCSSTRGNMQCQLLHLFVKKI